MTYNLNDPKDMVLLAIRVQGLQNNPKARFRVPMEHDSLSFRAFWYTVEEKLREGFTKVFVRPYPLSEEGVRYEIVFSK